MEGLLCHWALAIQEFSFETVHRKGTTNGKADALLCRSEPEIETHHAALTTVHAGFTAEKIRQARPQDDTIQQLYSALHSEQHFPHRNWKQPQICPALVTTGHSGWYCVQEVPATSFIGHCGPFVARNTAPDGSEYVPQLPSSRPSGDTEDAGEDTM